MTAPESPHTHHDLTTLENTQAVEQEETAIVLEDSIEEEPKPKRPLSAYNFFFKQQRLQLLRTRPIRPEGKPRRSHGKIGFADLARTIAARWKTTSEAEKQYFEDRSNQDKARYNREMEEWKRRQAVLAHARLKKECEKLDMEPIAYPKKKPVKQYPEETTAAAINIPVVSPVYQTKVMTQIDEMPEHLMPRQLSFDYPTTQSELRYSDHVHQYNNINNNNNSDGVHGLMLQYQQDPLPDIGWPDLQHHHHEGRLENEFDFPPTTPIPVSEIYYRQGEIDYDLEGAQFGWTGGQQRAGV